MLFQVPTKIVNNCRKTKKSDELPRPIFHRFVGLINQLIALATKTWQADAISVAALDSHLKNLKLWFQIVFHSQNGVKGYSTTGFAVNTEQPS